MQIDASTVAIDPNAQKVQGVPVSEGIVVGPARVILDFITEAHLIKRGDILVTRATDTGIERMKFRILGLIAYESLSKN